MTDEQVTLGEIYRLVKTQSEEIRHIARLSEVVPVLAARLDAHDGELSDLKVDMKAVKRDAAVVAGGSGMAAFLASIFWHH